MTEYPPVVVPNHSPATLLVFYLCDGDLVWERRHIVAWMIEVTRHNDNTAAFVTPVSYESVPDNACECIEETFDNVLTWVFPHDAEYDVFEEAQHHAKEILKDIERHRQTGPVH